MHIRFKIIYLFLLLLLAACSTNGREETYQYGEFQGGLSFSITPQELQSRASVLPIPVVDEFVISIYNDITDSLEYESQLGDMPIAVVLEEGEYRVEARSGFNEPFTTEFPTYYAGQSAVVEIGHNTQVDLTATIQSYVLDVNYSEDFLAAFSEYYIEVHIGDGRFSFAHDKNEVAYLAPGQCRLVLKGTTTDGRAYSSVIKEIISSGRELYELDLTIRPQGHSFDIAVDSSVENLDVSSNIDPSLYPDMHEIELGEMNFTETAIYDPASAANSTVTISALSYIKDVRVQFLDKKFLDYEIDTARVYALSSDDDRRDLELLGVEYSDDFVGAISGTLNFGLFAQQLQNVGGVTTYYKVKIIAVDQLEGVQGENLSDDVEMTLKLYTPQFSMPAVNLAKVWSGEFTVDRVAQQNVTKGDFSVMESRGGFSYEYRSEVSNWVAIDPSTLRVEGLEQSSSPTKYYVRAIYRGVRSSEAELSLEPTRQIPNNNFAQWYDAPVADQPCYWFYPEGASGADMWWATRNSKTASEGIDAGYTQYSGSRPLSGSGVDLVTCGWGAGNTNVLNSGDIIYNIWAGAIFIGYYTPDTKDNSQNEHHGKEFNSRPTAMTFDCQFAPYTQRVSSDSYVAKIWLENRSGESVTKIGVGNLSESTAISSWTNKTINITYTNTELPATHICIAFYSGINEGSSEYLNHRDAWSTHSSFTGTVFKVNNVTLVYDK